MGFFSFFRAILGDESGAGFADEVINLSPFQENLQLS